MCSRCCVELCSDIKNKSKHWNLNEVSCITRLLSSIKSAVVSFMSPLISFWHEMKHACWYTVSLDNFVDRTAHLEQDLIVEVDSDNDFLLFLSMFRRKSVPNKPKSWQPLSVFYPVKAPFVWLQEVCFSWFILPNLGCKSLTCQRRLWPEDG